MEEKVIENILCWKNKDGEWIKYTQEELTQKLQNWWFASRKILELLDMAASYDYLKSKASWIRSYLYEENTSL